MRDLRSRFVLAALVAAIAPLALVAIWMTRGVERAATDLVRAQLEGAKTRVRSSIEDRWLDRRSELLFLSQNQVVLDSLPGAVPGDVVPAFVADLYAELAGSVAAVRFFTASGELAWTLGTPRNADPGEPGLDEPMLLVRDTILGDRGELVGFADGWLATTAIFPSDLPTGGPGGTAVEIVDRRSGIPLRRFVVESGSDGWVVVTDSLDDPPLLIRLAAPVEPVQQPFQRASRSGAVAVATVATLALLATILLGTRLTHSLGQVAEAADAVAGGDLERRLDASAGGEVGRVAAAFNTMTDNLRASLRERSQRKAMAAVGEYASSLSHEVRNGLTSLRIDLQRAEEQLERDSGLRPLLARSLEKVASLDRTVSGALQIARSGSIERHRIDARSPLSAAAADVEGEFAAREVELFLDLPQVPVSLDADAGALRRALVNLLLNAAYAFVRGCHGAAWARVAADGEEVVFTVRDSGAGIPVELQSRVFEAFQSSKREGTGLGLSIARQIVQAHGGHIEIDSAPGRGTTVRIGMPLPT